MGVSISDLGRGYAWSDYIQLRFYHSHGRGRLPKRDALCQLMRASRVLFRKLH
ncbi:uncharacterized protein [Blastocystis hominis]|uniref:Uncharacterized protein n=1 Tax=Blastocystis hominis TaxID=12968 RepID=D8LV02_BLAHO|nr:uncharacterized protein [Blastocystis hominis]CBK19641.2 unnamed protein product [Blastocystis hominis]|eukprot:XP_012893689.1 uncharacterized protein [Blastocystis hominis]